VDAVDHGRGLRRGRDQQARDEGPSVGSDVARGWSRAGFLRGPTLLFALIHERRGKEAFSEVRGSKVGRSGRVLRGWTGGERGFVSHVRHAGLIRDEESLQAVAT
jgi:hypothetical protein